MAHANGPDIHELADGESWCDDEINRIRSLNPYLVMPNERSSIYEEIIERWQSIYKCYVAIARAGGADAGEAFKRAMFIYWYEVAEPFFLTGILNLDANVSNDLLELLEVAMADGDAGELKEMIAWYYQTTDYRFDALPQGEKIKNYCSRGSNLKWLTSEAQRATYSTRGLMGQYFLSLRPPK
jgi:hypothetical protein